MRDTKQPATARALLERILASGTVEDEQGNVLPLRYSNVSVEEGRSIAACIERHGFERTLEVGCAYGISALYICEAISRRPNPHHVMIDPLESTRWRNIGIRNLRDAGFEFWELLEQPSALALPSLVQRNLKVQFALIDGWHTFDQTLLDFFYVDKLLEDGGIVAIDDVAMPAINRVVRYALNYPTYRAVETVNAGAARDSSPAHRALGLLVRGLASLVPSGARELYFTDSCLRPSKESALTCDMIFLQKSGPDARPWDWYKAF